MKLTAYATRGMTRNASLALVVVSVLALSAPSALSDTGRPGRPPDPLRLFTLRATRDLSSAEAVRLADLVLLMISPREDLYRRREAAMLIGEEIGHVAAIHPLLRILEQSQEDQELRYWALTSVSQIADKSVIPVLLRYLEDPMPTVRMRAHEQLWKLAGASTPPGLKGVGPNLSRDERAATVARWKGWWQANEKTFVFHRDRVMVEW